MLWAEKYRPASIREIVGNPSATKQFLGWYDNWTPQLEKNKAIILRGPPGVGKTSLVHALANERALELVEINASDWRSQKLLTSMFDMTKTRRLDGAGASKLVLMDEVDGLSKRRDRGGVGALAKLIDNSLIPIIMTDNGYVSGFQPLYSRCQIIELRKMNKGTIAKVLAGIAQNEGIEIDPKALNILADNANGDLRAAIGDLQGCCFGLKQVTSGDISQALSGRDVTIQIFPMLNKIFADQSPFDSHASVRDLDLPNKFRSLISWVYENAHLWANSSSELVNMYKTIARADWYLGQIFRGQNWNLLKYLYTEITAGVNYAKKSPYKWNRAAFPYFPTLRKEGIERRERLRKIGRFLHCSVTKTAEYTTPFLPIIFQGQDPQMAAQIALDFNLADDEIKIFASRKSRSVRKYLEKLRLEMPPGRETISDEWLSSLREFSEEQKQETMSQIDNNEVMTDTQKTQVIKTSSRQTKKKSKKTARLDSFLN